MAFDRKAYMKIWRQTPKAKEYNKRYHSLPKSVGDRKAYDRSEHARAKARERRARNKAFRDEYLLTHPCVDCGEADPIVLDFDHVRGQKRYNVSPMWNSSYGLARIQAEIAKCEVRCSNCHRRKTHERLRSKTPSPVPSV